MVGVTASTRSLGTGHYSGDVAVTARPLSLLAAVRAPALAAGLLALAELALQRVGAPLASHLPAGSALGPIGGAVRSAGDTAVGATAVLVMVTALVAAVGLRHRPLLAAGLTAGVVSTLVATASDEMAVLQHTVLIAAVVVVAVTAATTVPGAWGGAIVAVGAVIVAGQLLLISDTAAPPAALAEGALVAVPLVLAAALWRDRRSGPVALAGAAGTALVMLAALLVEPGHAALVGLWSVAATLALPTPLYVAAAAALGLVMTTWLLAPADRHRAAGLLLVMVAGIQPALVHHNLTALVGLVLLAAPLAVPVARRTGGVDA